MAAAEAPRLGVLEEDDEFEEFEVEDWGAPGDVEMSSAASAGGSGKAAPAGLQPQDWQADWDDDDAEDDFASRLRAEMQALAKPATA
jgi:26 proteasome complex subunit DSS1